MIQEKPIFQHPSFCMTSFMLLCHGQIIRKLEYQNRLHKSFLNISNNENGYTMLPPIRTPLLVDAASHCRENESSLPV